jgi:hypothetical protein
MSLRTPLVAAVVGALLVGGAATGTTLALWHDSAAIGAGSLDSGTIGLTLNGATTVTFAALPTLPLNSVDTAGAPQSFSAAINNGSTGKNMRMQVLLDNVVASSSALQDNLELAVTTVASGGTCPATGQVYKSLNAYPVTTLTTTPLMPGVGAKLCVDVRVKANAVTNDIQGESGVLTFSLRGQQVRSWQG